MYNAAEAAYLFLMDTPDQSGLQLPAALMAEVEAMAAAEGRPAKDMLREVVERYVHEKRPLVGIDATEAAARRTAQDAAARMLARRRSHSLPAGMSIRDLTTFGRA